MPFQDRKNKRLAASALSAGYMSISDKVKLDGITNGWADYNDTATSSTPINLTANTFSQLTNDGLGAQTTEEYSRGLSFWNSSTNKLDISGTAVGDALLIRVELEVNPNINQSSVEFRLWVEAFGGFSLPVPLGVLDDGAGAWYRRIIVLPFYVGSETVRDNPIQCQIKCSSQAQVRINGFYVGVK